MSKTKFDPLSKSPISRLSRRMPGKNAPPPDIWTSSVWFLYGSVQESNIEALFTIVYVVALASGSRYLGGIHSRRFGRNLWILSMRMYKDVRQNV